MKTEDLVQLVKSELKVGASNRNCEFVHNGELYSLNAKIIITHLGKPFNPNQKPLQLSSNIHIKSATIEKNTLVVNHVYYAENSKLTLIKEVLFDKYRDVIMNYTLAKD